MRKLFLEEAKEVLAEVVASFQCCLRSRQCCVLWWTGSEKVRERPTWV